MHGRLDEEAHEAQTRAVFLLEALEILLAHVKTIYHRTDELLTSFKPDVVFAHHICTGTSWACARRGVPWATGVLSPAMWFNPRDPARYHPWAPENPSERFSRFGLWLGKLIMRWQFDRPLNATRRELGLRSPWVGAAVA